MTARHPHIHAFFFPQHISHRHPLLPLCLPPATPSLHPTTTRLPLGRLIMSHPSPSPSPSNPFLSRPPLRLLAAASHVVHQASDMQGACMQCSPPPLCHSTASCGPLRFAAAPALGPDKPCSLPCMSPMRPKDPLPAKSNEHEHQSQARAHVAGGSPPPRLAGPSRSIPPTQGKQMRVAARRASRPRPRTRTLIHSHLSRSVLDRSVPHEKIQFREPNSSTNLHDGIVSRIRWHPKDLVAQLRTPLLSREERVPRCGSRTLAIDDAQRGEGGTPQN